MVTVYSQPGCMQCTMLVRVLKDKGLAHEVRDVTKDEDAYNRVTELGYSSLPVAEYGEGKHFSGFRVDIVESLVA